MTQMIDLPDIISNGGILLDMNVLRGRKLSRNPSSGAQHELEQLQFEMEKCDERNEMKRNR
jgi:hypothetical protein